MLLLVLAAIGCYGMSLAPVTWVVISEIFPNRIRGAAMAVAVDLVDRLFHPHLHLPSFEQEAGSGRYLLALRRHLRRGVRLYLFATPGDPRKDAGRD